MLLVRDWGGLLRRDLGGLNRIQEGLPRTRHQYKRLDGVMEGEVLRYRFVLGRI